MARHLRDTSPEKVHLITTRTASAELLLVPNSELNALLGGILARYAEAFEIEVFAYCFLSNHYHLLVRAPEALLPRFVENLNREIAQRINRFLGRSGSLWGRRYDDQVTIEPYDALDALLYVVTNPVRHGLVSHPRSWPGIGCYKQILIEESRDFYFTHYADYLKAKRRASSKGEQVRIGDFQTKHTLSLTPIPIFEDLTPQERVVELERLIERRIEKLVKERRLTGQGFLGRKGVLRQPRRGRFPDSISSSPRPPCYTKNAKAGASYVEEMKGKREVYNVASFRYRSGHLLAIFPPYCFKPPLHHPPRQYLLRPAPD